MDKNLNSIIEINIKDLFYALLKKSWFIVLLGIICAAGARYYSSNYKTPIYSSSSKLYITNKQDGQNTTLSDLQIGSYLTKDYMILVKSRPVAEEVIRRLNLKMSSNQLISMISVFTPDETRILQISVSYYDRKMVKTIVDTLAQVSSERMKSIMGLEQVNVLEEGYFPYAPISPNILRYTKIGGIAGMLFAVCIIVLFYLLNDSIKSSDEVEKYLGLTTLGFIPVEVAVKRRKEKKEKKEKNKKAA